MGKKHHLLSAFLPHLCSVFALRSYIALLLLLCLTRTLLPEAWVLDLHAHSHTTEEPAQAPAFQTKGKALVSSQHQHCAVDHFYDVPFLPGAPVMIPVQAVPLFFASVPVPTVATAPWIARIPAQLRGPPTA
ncbi:hypothetical protein LJY25_11545 [Hymenobacter sp. BT175]|uniref:hypothetical protein n=1 Tax=Hymenobacter translucens TaxID=2886507 RepID=UPI001D0F1024|nr:hypothetical protein [Hymenobacter translucens]MCC2547083.1 hypothetical protein [Hymenobacter translucens]